MKIMNKELKIATDMICKILNNYNEPTFEGFREIFDIRKGNKELLLKHLKAIYNIFGKAIEQLEKGEDNENDNTSNRTNN